MISRNPFKAAIAVLWLLFIILCFVRVGWWGWVTVSVGAVLSAIICGQFCFRFNIRIVKGY